jgi:hypothetical protein
MPEDKEWIETSRKVQLRDFQQACDKLEGLVVARCFELTKMHQSELGNIILSTLGRKVLIFCSAYKLQKQISNGLQTQSDAIRHALADYNRLAQEVQPPRPILNSDEILEYTQIGQFAFLKDSQFGITAQPWAQPVGCQAMDIWFKIQRAHEELIHVKVEARRLVTYITNKERFLAMSLLQLSDHTLATQLK